jgi:hypothetical protein
VPVANGGKRAFATRAGTTTPSGGCLALRGTSKLVGNNTYDDLGRNRTIASASSKSRRSRAWARSH